MTRLSLDDVRRAREVIGRHLPPTPLRRSFALRPRQAFLKLECWQPTGSFKVRGALNVLASLTPEERGRGVVAASAGNHALGVAFAAQALGGGLETTLFVPESAPRSKVEKLRSFPVTVHERGATYDDAYDAAIAHAERTGARYVHAYEDAVTAAGQGTTGLEILEQQPDLGAVLVPVGGGGLVTGIAVVLKALAPHVRVIGVQADASPSLPDSLAQGKALLRYPAEPTLADGISGGIGEIVFEHRDLLDGTVTVSEAEIEDAIVALLAEDQVVAEGSGAVGVAALRSGRFEAPADRSVAVIITGANIDAGVLGRLLAQRTPRA
jgi:threonine dehydratase